MGKAQSLGVGVPEDFVPTTDMERAYVQARPWPADRAWKRAYTQVSEGQIAMGVGMYLCLLDYYARRDGIEELFRTCEWILTRMNELRPAERLSVCKIVCSIVKSLKEDEFDVKEARLKLILRIPLAVILDAVAEQRLSCALTGLLEFSRVFEESITIKECSEFEGDFLGVALAIDRAIRAGTVRDKFKASELNSPDRYENSHLDDVQNAELAKNELEIDVSGDRADEPNQMSSPAEPALPVLPPGDMPSLRDQVRDFLNRKSDTGSSNLVAAQKPFAPPSSRGARLLESLVELNAAKIAKANFELGFDNVRVCLERDGSDVASNLIWYVVASIGKVNERQNLLSVLSFMDQSNLLTSERATQIDTCFGIILWRLCSLWAEADLLFEGRGYCDSMLQRFAKEKNLEDALVRQLSSSVKFLSAAIIEKQAKSNAKSRLELPAIEQSAEFVSMMTALALHEYQGRRFESVQLVLREFNTFYSSSLAQMGLWFGQVLWLNLETSLFEMREFTLALIRQSQKLAIDQAQSERLDSRVRRLLDRVEDIDYAKEIMAQLIVSKRDEHAYISYEDRVFQVRNLLSWRFYLNDFQRESQDEWKAAEAQEKNEWRQNAKSEATLRNLTRLAGKRDWLKFAQSWSKMRERLFIGDSIFRLGQLGLLAARDGQLSVCKHIISALKGSVTPSCMYMFNFLSECCARRYCDARDYELAALLLEEALRHKYQLRDHCNSLRMQLAENYLAQGNFFKATALIYEAYSNISGSEYDGVQLTSAE